METVDINIQLFNDNISESEEIFFLILDIPEDISDVVTTTGGGVCLIRIQSSGEFINANQKCESELLYQS